MAVRSNRGGHIAGEDISAYVDDELSSREVQRVYGHLQACDECRALEDDLRATKTLVREMPLMRAPRDFTLGPEYNVAPSYKPAPRRWFNFMPAVAMSAALLVLLIFVDVSSLGSGVEDGSGGSGPSAGARSVEDASKQSAESATGSQPLQPQLLPRSGQPVPGGNTQGFVPTPAAGGGATAPQPAAAPPGGTPMAAQGPAPIIPNATPAPLMLPPVIGSPISGNSLGIPTPETYAVVVGPDEAGAERDEGDGGTSVLRVLQIVAGLVLVGSIGGLIWQRRRGT